LKYAAGHIWYAFGSTLPLMRVWTQMHHKMWQIARLEHKTPAKPRYICYLTAVFLHYMISWKSRLSAAALPHLYSRFYPKVSWYLLAVRR
ncbi:MAG: hypothetical protein IJC70_06890, partial [Firmicutes bacterium]|nr:hypothetical protein [Bacillota bacterium]